MAPTAAAAGPTYRTDPAGKVSALRPVEPFGTREKLHIGAFVVCVLASEAVLVYANVPAGLTLHALVVFAALSRAAISGFRSKRLRVRNPVAEILPAIASVSLLRIISAAVPVKTFPAVLWPAVSGLPLLLMLFLAYRTWMPRGVTFGLSVKNWPLQLLIAVGGVGLGTAGFVLIGRAGPSRLEPAEYLAGSLVLVLFGGFLEEMLFRGFVQRTLGSVLGGWSVLWTSLLYAGMYLGSQPIWLFVFMAAAGAFFGACAWMSRSTAGVAVAHALSNLFLFVLLPSSLEI